MKLDLSPRNENGSILNRISAIAVSAAVISAVVWSAWSVSSQRTENHAMQNPQGTAAPYFSVVGSAGTVDDADTGIYRSGGSIMQMLGSAPAVSTLNVRYSVHAVDNLVATFNTIDMDVRYRDNGTEAQVIVKLKELNMTTGLTTTRLSFNSNNISANAGFQKGTISKTDVAWQFDFAGNVYYLDVIFKTTGASGKPAVAGIVISTSPI